MPYVLYPCIKGLNRIQCPAEVLELQIISAVPTLQYMECLNMCQIRARGPVWLIKLDRSTYFSHMQTKFSEGDMLKRDYKSNWPAVVVTENDLPERWVMRSA